MNRKVRKPCSGNCAYCGTWRASLHKDHILPLWFGGTDTEDNIQYLCANCHEDKTNEERSSPEYSEMMKQRWADPAFRARASQRMLRQNADPEFRAKATAGTRSGRQSARRSELNKTDEHRSKVSTGLKRWYSNPANREQRRQEKLGRTKANGGRK